MSTHEAAGGRSALGTIARALTRGPRLDTFALGGLLALVTGVIAWIRGRSRGLLGDVRAGQMAVGWVVVAVLLSLIVSAFD